MSGAGFRVPTPLGELITTADAIVVGTIVSVATSSFTLELNQTLAGEVGESPIEVEKFPAPPASPRWVGNAKGQDVLLFLVKTQNHDPAERRGSPGWRILGRIGEGEIPLDEAYAYFHGRYVDSLPQDYYPFHGKTSYIQRFDRKATFDAVRTYSTCFEWPDSPREKKRPAVVCSAAALSAYQLRSPLHDFLVREAAP